MTILYLVLVFGFVGAPGDWTVAIQDYHQSRAPPLGSWQDVVPYPDEFLMDDGILIEPKLGLRPWLSAHAFGEAVEKLLGPYALNNKKLDDEGAFAERQTARGLDLDTARLTLGMPEPRILKAACTLHQECFDPGSKHIPLRALQQLRCIGTYMAVVQPALHTELVAVDQLPAQTTPGAPYACLPWTPGEVEAKYRDLWDSAELVRVLVVPPRNRVSEDEGGRAARRRTCASWQK